MKLYRLIILISISFLTACTLLSTPKAMIRIEMEWVQHGYYGNDYHRDENKWYIMGITETIYQSGEYSSDDYTFLRSVTTNDSYMNVAFEVNPNVTDYYRIIGFYDLDSDLSYDEGGTNGTTNEMTCTNAVITPKRVGTAEGAALTVTVSNVVFFYED